MVVRRFLLDQNFPAPVVDVHAVDMRVQYVPLKVFDLSLTKARTPDWLIFLRAARDGHFAGVVTRDKSQLDQPEELVALMDTSLTVVTWQHPLEDPIQEWGQLVAFMPLILKRLDAQAGAPKAQAFVLPKPRIGRDNELLVRDLLGKRASREGRSFPDIRAAARTEMRLELQARHLGDLASLLRSESGAGP